MKNRSVIVVTHIFVSKNMFNTLSINFVLQYKH